MTDSERPEDSTPDGVVGRSPSRGRRRAAPPPKSPRKGAGRVWLALVLVATVGVGTWWYFNQGDTENLVDDFTDGDVAIESQSVAGDRAVVLVFPEWDASGYVTEERQIPSRNRPGEDLFGLMKVLCAGPDISGAISALPKGTQSLAAFYNPDDQSVVLDFSQELVTAHPGGSAAEAATLTSILRTVALNFPQSRSCVILVEGAQVETLAGHLDLLRRFDPRRWL
ncbi:MAG: hypothetical protein ACI9UK_002028 [Candidatus Krumholzibacteriia bacterium]|jgi:hypothetical protein